MEEESEGTFPIKPLVGTYIIGMSNAIPALICIVTINWFGRRTLYIQGQFFMALFCFLCGLALLNNYNMAAFITLCLFITSY